jgi:putative acetyltransferase
MQLRRYKVGEEAAIWDVVFQATRVSNARDYHPELIDRWAPHDKDMEQWAERLADTNPFVAIIGEQIVGMAELDPSGYIDYFYVHPKFQGKGVGTALMAAIEIEASQTGASRLSADVSVTAKPFFESRGFFVVEARSNIVIGHPAPQFAMASAPMRMTRRQNRSPRL